MTFGGADPVFMILIFLAVLSVWPFMIWLTQKHAAPEKQINKKVFMWLGIGPVIFLLACVGLSMFTVFIGLLQVSEILTQVYAQTFFILIVFTILVIILNIFLLIANIKKSLF